MKPIIEVNNLYKKYKIGQVQPYLTLRDSLINLFKKPFRKRKNSTSGILDKNEFWALKDISFNITQGEAVGIIGRNGAGKSTLLKVLSRITPPTRGEIRLGGRITSLLEIGTGFHQELTGRENIYLNGAILGMEQKEIKKKFDEIVDFAEIEKFLDTPVKFYSSGMYMRLAFAVAAHLDSEILLVDEVLAVGDAAFQKKCLGKMESVTSQGRTVFFVSHNMDAIRNICSRVILLNQGCVLSDNKTEESLNIYNKLLKTIKISAKTSINDSRVRRGSGVIRFTNVEILNQEGKNQLNFKMGDTVRLKMSYKAYKDLKGLVVYIALRSGISRDIVTSVRHVISKDLILTKTEGNITLELPEISLRPGEYPLYFHISELYGSITNFDVLDDLTAPLIVVASTDRDNESGLLQLKGYFSISSKLIINKIYK